MAADWTLVGRDALLARVDESRRAGEAGVLLGGPAGVGKTRLALECLSRAKAAGHPTARVRANRAAATIPYGAFAPLLPPDTTGEGPAETLRRAADAVIAMGRERALFLVVDDAPELDDASMALLHHLVGGDGIFLLVTVRTEGVVPEPVVSLWKDELLTRVDVPPLALGDVGRLVAGVLGGPVDGGTGHLLWSKSGGNPLFLRELVAGAIDSGALRESGGIWRLAGDLTPSSRLREVVEVRLGALQDDERAVLEVVSVGEPVLIEAVEDVAPPDRIDDLSRRGLVQSQVDDGRTELRMGHPLYGEVLRAAMPPRRYAEICRLLVDAADAQDLAQPGDLLRKAVWLLDGGGEALPETLMAASQRAYTAGDPHLAMRLARAAVDGGGGVGASYLLGLALAKQGRHEDAEAVLAAAQQVTESDVERAGFAMARSGNMYIGLGRTTEADAILLAAEDDTTDVDIRHGLALRRSGNIVFDGRLRDALAIVEPLLEASELACAQGALAGAVALALTGRTADAVAVAARGAAARAELGDVLGVPEAGMYAVSESTALAEAGRLREAEAIARPAYDDTARIGSTDGQAWLASTLARIALHRGRAASAARWGREAGVLWRELQHPSARWGFGALAVALAMSGEVDAAERVYAELDAETRTPVRLFAPDIDRGRAFLAVQRGERELAATILEQAVSEAEATEAWSSAAMVLHDLCRLGEVARAGERLLALADRVDGEFMRARVAHVTALAADDADALDAAAEALDVVGALLPAAEAALAAGARHAAEGLLRKQAVSERRGRALLDQCEGARPLGVVVTDEPITLTQREREVATLAAGGMSNRDIADRLVVSPRTVENHLQRAYEKLGVRSRDDLSAALALDDG